MTAAPDRDVRRPGRPRDERADRAIVQATLEMLVDDGYHALSVEAVAAKAGCGKTTIYRRWPSKRELVSDALGAINADLPDLPPPGPTRDRVRTLLMDIRQKQPRSVSARIMPRMLAYRSSHPELYADYVERVIRPRRERLQRVLRDGVERGEVRSDIDLELAALCLSSPLMMRSMSAPDGSVPAAEVEALLDIAWRGIGTGQLRAAARASGS